MTARLAVTIALGAAVLGASALAHAEPLDPALERLVIADPETGVGGPACHGGAGASGPGFFGQYTPEPVPGGGALPGGRTIPCNPDNAAFTKLISQFGFGAKTGIVLGTRLPTGRIRKTQAIALALGVLVLLVAFHIPVFGVLTMLGVISVALGAMIRTRFGQTSRGMPMVDRITAPV